MVVIATVILGGLYVSNAWSPSSYGHVLVNFLGDKDVTPDFGSPQPVRGDEWSVITPLVQATINNNFERINHTSLYQEDLRSNYGLPIKDWGLAFKPTMWLYGHASAAYAYSLHWFALAALFLIGYAWIFRWFGASPVFAFALSGGLYFTSFVQFWWNSKGPELAMFPWVILPFATRLPTAIKAILFYWFTVSWLVTNFYPPVQIPLAFVGLLLLVVRQPSALLSPQAIAVASAAILAVATVTIYLWDYLFQINTTVYPGARRLAGGELPWWYLRTWLWPTADGYQPLLAHDSPELGAPGMYFTLMAFSFIDYFKWRNLWSDTHRRTQAAILLLGLLAMLAWMTLPLPSWLGSLFLWQYVQGSRMLFAFSVLHICVLLIIVKTLGFKITWVRFLVFVCLIVVPWLFPRLLGNRTHTHEDFVVLFFLVPAFLYARSRPHAAFSSFGLASLASGIAIFGTANPLQSAWPIFDRQATPVIHSLNRMANDNGGILVAPRIPGAIANGLGFRSVGHVLPTPMLRFWRDQFPMLGEVELNTIFNRYAHIVPSDEPSPHLISDDVVGVPIQSFVGIRTQLQPGKTTSN